MTPSKEIRKAVTLKLKGLNYSFNGMPRVEIYSLNTAGSFQKDDKDFEVSFIIEVIATDLDTSLTMIDNIRTTLDGTILINGYKVIYLAFEILNEIEEITDSNYSIWRQIQQVRIQLNKQ